MKSAGRTPGTYICRSSTRIVQLRTRPLFFRVEERGHYGRHGIHADAEEKTGAHCVPSPYHSHDVGMYREQNT